jgi:hypothetical protein
MSLAGEPLPRFSETVVPPLVCGIADLTDFAYQKNDFPEVIDRVDRFHQHDRGEAWDYDAAIACQLAFRRAEGLGFQDAALERSQIFRVRASTGSLRLLALAAPGDLMTNTPLDFLTNYLDVRLDILYLLPGGALPAAIPDHDVAFFGVGEADPPMLARLETLYATWPRPVLNNPRFLPTLARDALSRSLSGLPGICSPIAVAVPRPVLDDHLRSGRPVAGFDTPRGLYPCIVRPATSHAGAGLSRIASPAELAEYLQYSFEKQFFVTAFEDYRSADGFYRKSRVAFIDRIPYLCHMAVSQHWMVHYLNAGMTDSAEKRADEARAMTGFDTGFARRHAAAFAALHERLGFDFYSIDCAETHDGRLLVFEADTAAIIHLMDPPDMFPYKQPQMRRVFAAFGDLLQRSAGR